MAEVFPAKVNKSVLPHQARPVLTAAREMSNFDVEVLVDAMLLALVDRMESPLDPQEAAVALTKISGHCNDRMAQLRKAFPNG